jgi:hypothetical protein
VCTEVPAGRFNSSNTAIFPSLSWRRTSRALFLGTFTEVARKNFLFLLCCFSRASDTLQFIAQYVNPVCLTQSAKLSLKVIAIEFPSQDELKSGSI